MILAKLSWGNTFHAPEHPVEVRRGRKPTGEADLFHVEFCISEQIGCKVNPF